MNIQSQTQKTLRLSDFSVGMADLLFCVCVWFESASYFDL